MKKHFKMWRKFLNESLDPDENYKQGSAFYNKFVSDASQSAGIKEKPAKIPTTSPSACESKPACGCVDNSETQLSVTQIQKILKVEPTGLCDLTTQKAIMKFQKEAGIECDGCVGDETHGKMLELKVTTIPLSVSNFSSSKPNISPAGSTSTDVQPTNPGEQDYVKVALEQLPKFNYGKLHEREPEAWPHIAEYWSSIGYGWAARGTMGGYYRKQPNKWHWSAAFIQYCMRGNAEFQNLAWKGRGKGNHQYYWRAAEINTKKLRKGNLPEGEWFFLYLDEAKRIGYSMQPGDISFQGRGGKLHGDIVVAPGKHVGGNLRSSVKYSSARRTAVMTQNPVARERFVKYYAS